MWEGGFKMLFSSTKRSEILDEMMSGCYDVLVIGGGITGAGIALDAASRGLKIALVEMRDFAAGTSSRSTKLVHGGLRYLKQFEVKMVAEIGKERAIVHENGPHVTTPEWMMLPIHKGGTFGKFSTNIGLRLYEFLAGVKKAERRKMLSAAETAQKEPLLKKDGLIGGGYYVEYRTDDARLTIEVMKAAVEKGATAINYAKAEEFTYQDKKITGVKIRDMLNNTIHQIYAKKIINAAGPWVEKICLLDYPINKKKLRLTKGVHIVFDHSVFPIKQAIYFHTPDGRMMFAIPRDGKVYVGTTDTFFDKDVENPKVLKEDREYILNAVHHMFPEVKITEQDIESSWAGVRPLIYEKGKDPSEISRKDEIWEGESGLITIAGGKLTGYRKMAETVVNLISNQACSTNHLPISGGNVGGSANFTKFIENKKKEAIHYGLTAEEGEQFARMYGSNVDLLFEFANYYKTSGVEEAIPATLYAQVMYAIHYEMTVKPVDFFIRRTGALFFDMNWVKKWKDIVIDMMAKELEWSEESKNQYMIQLDEEINHATSSNNYPPITL